MMDTGSFVHSLPNVKLVLGNGFDLHCKLHSSYWNYFQKHRNRFNFIGKWLNSYIGDKKYFVDNQFSNKVVTDGLNVWDYFFGVLKTIDKDTKKHDWCDIENIIKLSLIKQNASEHILSWGTIYRVIKDKLDFTNNYPYIDAMAAVVCSFHKEDFDTEEEYYEFLLEELKKFEKNFGNFIYNQHENINRRYLVMGLINDRYISCAELTIDTLCDIGNVTSIDLFNYVGIGIPKIDEKINYINGDYNQPIFGIDTISNLSSPIFMFTKVNRRIINHMINNKISEQHSFSHLMVYGHSLNEFDYNYFFPMFDRLKLGDTTRDSVFVFAYTIYNENQRALIQKTNRKRVYKLLEAYAKSRKIAFDIIETLSIQKRIIFYEVPEITGREYNYKSHFDDDEYEDESE